MCLKSYEDIKFMAYLNCVTILVFTLLVASEYWISPVKPPLPAPLMDPIDGICYGMSAVVICAFWQINTFGVYQDMEDKSVNLFLGLNIIQ